MVPYPALLPCARRSTSSSGWKLLLKLKSQTSPAMADPLDDAQTTRKLLQILDAIGTEHDIRSLLIGGTVSSHLAALTTKPATPARR